MNYNYIGIFEFKDTYYEVASIKENNKLLLRAGRCTNTCFLYDYEVEYEDDAIDEGLVQLYDMIQEAQ